MHPAAAAGVIAGDGHFSVSPDGRSFALVVQVDEADLELCQGLRSAFGVGTVRVGPPRRPGGRRVAVFQVRRLGDLAEVVVPALDAWLPRCHKRSQFDRWRDVLLARWRSGTRRPRVCTLEGCEQRHRARGLCRRHYYEQFRR